MAEEKQKENQVVVINDVEYNPKDFSEEQVILVNHVADLDRKLANSRFNLDQLQGGREFFMKKLEENLEENPVKGIPVKNKEESSEEEVEVVE